MKIIFGQFENVKFQSVPTFKVGLNRIQQNSPYYNINPDKKLQFDILIGSFKAVFKLLIDMDNYENLRSKI